MEDNTQPTPAVDTNTQTEDTNPALDTRYARRRSLVTYGSIFVLLGWLIMMFYPYISIGCDLVGLVCCIIGVRIPAGARRNLAITAIVAGGVLLIVYALFATLLYMI